MYIHIRNYNTHTHTHRFQWRIKHPQGQIESAHVAIQIRSVNKPPAAFPGSVTLAEDSTVVITLNGSDVDDGRKPQFYVSVAPKNGFLHQCVTSQASNLCSIGERISTINESVAQWASITVDPGGALDGLTTPVYRIVEAAKGSEMVKQRIDVSEGTPLQTGYGFNSWNIDPDAPDNFKRLCGGRGSVAGVLLLEAPVFVTDVEIFYPIRYARAHVCVCVCMCICHACWCFGLFVLWRENRVLCACS
jgi:hypothetical protein